jgi:hypothetical protein
MESDFGTGPVFALGLLAILVSGLWTGWVAIATLVLFVIGYGQFLDTTNRYFNSDGSLKRRRRRR